MTPVETLLAVAHIGGRLGAVGSNLQGFLPANCPVELKGAIRQQKLALLELLRLNFLVVRSDALKALLFWTPSEATKEVLIAGGADTGSVYTAGELAQLVNRRATTADLLLLHAARQRFQGKLTEPH
jgi:hypothetical protein